MIGYGIASRTVTMIVSARASLAALRIGADMAKLIEAFRLERHYNGGVDTMCECTSYDTCEKALLYYGATDVPGVYYKINKVWKVVDDD